VVTVMSDEQNISRRTALKVIAVGVGTAGALPILEETTLGQHSHTGMVMQKPADEAVQVHRFFNAQEIATIATISGLIIPADEQSPGTDAAGVPAFIDLMVSESSAEVKRLWHEGLMAIERISQERFSTSFITANLAQQLTLLKAISKNEYNARSIEERFFVAIKGLTVDGYYTSQVGIHQELHYKGNAYLKDFVGCTHPEHQS
jgi:gluconate 2-dehydrogenase subunit 3-like protein